MNYHNVIKNTLWLGLFFSLTSNAAVDISLVKTSSITGIKSTIDSQNAIEKLKQASSLHNQLQVISADELNTNDSQTENSKLTSKIITNTGNKKRSLAEHLQQLNQYDYSFSIYQAQTRLIDDYDADGYYQTFSISFDADLISYSHFERADVYAELYLSFNGGPWQHYLTTDIFTLYGESSDDEYSIHTRLNQGYVSGEYDILIDLYEVGYDDIVASYSADDDAALIALPLESDEYDEVYVETNHTDIHYHGGSVNFTIIAMLMCLLVYRLSLSKTLRTE